MDEDFALGKRLWERLDQRASKNAQVHQRNFEAKNKINDVILPAITRGSKVNQSVLAAIREIYTIIEDGDEEQSQTFSELELVRDSLGVAMAMLEEAGFDIANIQTFSNDEIWLADHLPTIKRMVDIVNLQKLEVALDEAKKERFEDFAHAVKRSGEKRSG